MNISVIYQDQDFLVLNKPAGVSVHPVRRKAPEAPAVAPRARRTSNGVRGAGVKGETITDWLIEKYPEVKTVGDVPEERPGIVHRLDRDTSGVMIVARNQDTFENLKQLFKERKVSKKYLALVSGAPKKKSGVIDEPIGRSAGNPTRRGVGLRARGARAALTRYNLLERLGVFSLLECEPKTGRTHQLRVHLASIGCPVAGDKVYGKRDAAIPPGLKRQFLHAFSVEFSYPEGRRWHFEAALPEDLDAVLKSLRELRKTRQYAKN